MSQAVSVIEKSLCSRDFPCVIRTAHVQDTKVEEKKGMVPMLVTFPASVCITIITS